MQWASILAEGIEPVETLDPNGERGRFEPQKRPAWASALVKPQTVKALLLVLSVVAKLVGLPHEVNKFFRE